MVFKIIIVGSSPAFPVCFIFMKIYFILNSLYNLVFNSNIFEFKERKLIKFLPTFLFKFYSNRLFFFKNDFFFLKTFFFFFNKSYKFRSNFRTGFKKSGNYLYFGFIFVWKHLQLWIPVILLILLVFYFSLVIKCYPFLKIVAQWFFIIMFGYWLISGFVFFSKKYKFGKFTSSIQRFWRRSFIIFWLIESCLFIVFLYLLFNASQEPVFAYDLIQLKKMRLFSWRFFLLKIFPVVLLIIVTYILILCIKWNVYSKYLFMLGYITFLLTYVFWVEFYQFFYIINWYNEIIWLFDQEDRTWYAENLSKRARIVNHYVTICTIAKFWHIVFIYIFWIFFLLRSLENKNISYVLLTANFQNFIILYVMNWLLMYPWFKNIFRKFFSKTHQSFYEFRKNYVNNFFNDFYLYLQYSTNCNFLFKHFTKKKFIYFIESFENNNNFYFCKQFIKNYIGRIYYS